MIFTREVRSTKMNSLVGDLLSLTRKCSGAPVHERTRTRRIRRGGGAPVVDRRPLLGLQLLGPHLALSLIDNLIAIRIPARRASRRRV